VLRFLDQKEIKAQYHRVDKGSKNFGRLFIYFRHKEAKGRKRRRLGTMSRPAGPKR
jgi:hypothetical protein